MSDEQIEPDGHCTQRAPALPQLCTFCWQTPKSSQHPVQSSGEQVESVHARATHEPIPPQTAQSIPPEPHARLSVPSWQL